MTAIQGDATKIGSWSSLPSGVRCIITSPPYAAQRSMYTHVAAAAYPEFTVGWMAAARSVLLADAVVAIVIRPNQKAGKVSDYVLKTRLAVQQAGWLEIEELIWVKTDPPPLGSTRRPRRAWESILLYSRVQGPFINTRAGGKITKRVYKYGDISSRSGELHSGQKDKAGGKTRGTDVIETACGNGIDKKWPHPAPFPTALSDHLVDLLSEDGDMVCDPFCGSGTTGESAVSSGRLFAGMDMDASFVGMTNRRVGSL